MIEKSGTCVKIANRWDCVICNLVCKDRIAKFDVEMWRKVVK